MDKNPNSIFKNGVVLLNKICSKVRERKRKKKKKKERK